MRETPLAGKIPRTTFPCTPHRGLRGPDDSLGGLDYVLDESKLCDCGNLTTTVVVQ
jgi:hypothetical protein